MESVEKVSIRDIVKDLDLKIVHMPKNKDYYVYFNIYFFFYNNLFIK